jgi:phosphoribulokinase
MSKSLGKFESRRPDFEAFIEPQRGHADVVIQVLPTKLLEDKESKLLRVRLMQREGVSAFDPVYLFDEGSTIDWRPCGRKLTCNFPGIKMFYGPDTYYGNPVSVLELDGQLEQLEEVSYIESHLSNISTKYHGEMTHLLLQHKEYPGSNNGTGLFQVMVGLKMRATYELLTSKEAQVTGKVAAKV